MAAKYLTRLIQRLGVNEGCRLYPQTMGRANDVQDGCAAIDNNSAELSIRPFALGREKYLFAGSVAGGERAAVLYTMTCPLSLAFFLQ